jgi:hypothetical protein
MSVEEPNSGKLKFDCTRKTAEFSNGSKTFSTIVIFNGKNNWNTILFTCIMPTEKRLRFPQDFFCIPFVLGQVAMAHNNFSIRGSQINQQVCQGDISGQRQRKRLNLIFQTGHDDIAWKKTTEIQN